MMMLITTLAGTMTGMFIVYFIAFLLTKNEIIKAVAFTMSKISGAVAALSFLVIFISNGGF